MRPPAAWGQSGNCPHGFEVAYRAEDRSGRELDLDHVERAGLWIKGCDHLHVLLIVFLGFLLIVQKVAFAGLRIRQQGILTVFRLDDFPDVSLGLLVLLLVLCAEWLRYRDHSCRQHKREKPGPDFSSFHVMPLSESGFPPPPAVALQRHDYPCSRLPTFRATDFYHYPHPLGLQ